MSAPAAPAMSVVVMTQDRYDALRKTVRHLRAQKGRERLEIVVVAPARPTLGLDETELSAFWGHRVVEVGDMSSTPRARAIAVRHATAPVVAFVEEHAYPAPGWAEALIVAHRDDWAAVGPTMANANPHSLVSWANFIIEYGPWSEPAAGGPAEHLPGHNCSYKRALLLEYGSRLEGMLDAESLLHWDLRAKGHRLRLDPDARIFHQNFTAIRPSLTLRFHGGRLFAASRARGWSRWRRLLYGGAGCLIPVVRGARIARELRRPGRPRHLLPRILPALLGGLVVDAAGEMVGYSFGDGNARARLGDMEFHRERYVKARGATPP